MGEGEREWFRGDVVDENVKFGRRIDSRGYCHGEVRCGPKGSFNPDKRATDAGLD
jgi:hypothetical protein